MDPSRLGESSSPSLSPVLPNLSREVLPPLRVRNGFGVMLVASAAMFVAVATTAFSVQAAATDCPYQRRFVQSVPAVAAAKPDVERREPACGKPVYQRNERGDGYQVYFSVCPDTLTIIVVDEDESVEDLLGLE